MMESLNNVIKNGVSPKTVIDVGVATGTLELYDSFPNANFMLIEPLDEFLPYLESLTIERKNFKYILAAARSKSGNVTINVHPDLHGSSLLLEEEDSNVNGYERIVPSVRLDEIYDQPSVNAPFLIKIDTQGSEIEVLMGAEEILKHTEFIILEATFFNVFKNGFQIVDYIDFMKEHNFVPYDLFSPLYRPLDGAMIQIDIAFVPQNSFLRKFHFYATKEQREKQNEIFKKSLSDSPIKSGFAERAIKKIIRKFCPK